MLITVLLFIFSVIFIAFFININKIKEELTIFKGNSSLYFFLNGDEYLKIKIDNESALEECITKIVKNRAFELKELIDRVSLINIGNKELEQKVLNIILKHP